MHSRDKRFKNQARHKAKPDPLYDKAHPKNPSRTMGGFAEEYMSVTVQKASLSMPMLSR